MPTNPEGLKFENVFGESLGGFAQSLLPETAPEEIEGAIQLGRQQGKNEIQIGQEAVSDLQEAETGKHQQRLQEIQAQFGPDKRAAVRAQIDEKQKGQRIFKVIAGMGNALAGGSAQDFRTSLDAWNARLEKPMEKFEGDRTRALEGAARQSGAEEADAPFRMQDLRRRLASQTGSADEATIAGLDPYDLGPAVGEMQTTQKLRGADETRAAAAAKAAAKAEAAGQPKGMTLNQQNSLFNDLEKGRGEYNDTDSKLGVALEGTEAGTADMVALMTLISIVDNTAAREGEVRVQRELQSLTGRLQGLVGQVRRGDAYGPDKRAEVLSILTRMRDANREGYNAWAKRAVTRTEHLQLDPKTFAPEFYDDTFPSSDAAGAAPGGQASAVGGDTKESIRDEMRAGTITREEAKRRIMELRSAAR